MTTPKKPTSEKRKASRKSYEDKALYKPLSVRVHDNRREKVKEYARTGKCPDKDYLINLLREQITALEGYIRSSQNESA